MFIITLTNLFATLYVFYYRSLTFIFFILIFNSIRTSNKRSGLSHRWLLLHWPRLPTLTASNPSTVC